MDSPSKHSSLNCTWPWDFYIVLVVIFESQYNSIGYSSWIGLSRYEFWLIWLYYPSLPMKIFSIIPIFHFPRFFSSHFIMTTLLISIFTGFSLWLRLCLSLRVVKYLWTHILQAASLHLCTYLNRFFQLSFNFFLFWRIIC